jgi:hypothetical protein
MLQSIEFFWDPARKVIYVCFRMGDETKKISFLNRILTKERTNFYKNWAIDFVDQVTINVKVLSHLWQLRKNRDKNSELLGNIGVDLQPGQESKFHFVIKSKIPLSIEYNATEHIYILYCNATNTKHFNCSLQSYW